MISKLLLLPLSSCLTPTDQPPCTLPCEERAPSINLPVGHHLGGGTMRFMIESMTLPSLPGLFESCPNLVFQFVWSIKRGVDAAKEDFWKTDPAVKAIIEAVRRTDGELNVADVGIQALLHHSPTITELSLLKASLTLATIHALQSHRPLTLLTLGRAGEEEPLFVTEDAEIAFGKLLCARGVSLTRLRFGGPDWPII
ncbi:hypothetical protein BDK51DRAFT_34816 [Blyttiomyces helicus]|uniref:Uncharacterized protein n=1 Tax=Blyttiomyces helicus TaxID=388810 RepID=A0A4V1IS85_9FUNG|nr:hypothetical protein BDK51DRAFT_34816 [Blyttiomyces helicus]|eukprot:RKO92677.1 hypothetical protein BDK51DRAFT_34816 [Blyttiomyces helicus]